MNAEDYRLLNGTVVRDATVDRNRILKILYRRDGTRPVLRVFLLTRHSSVFVFFVCVSRHRSCVIIFIMRHKFYTTLFIFCHGVILFEVSDRFQFLIPSVWQSWCINGGFRSLS